MKKWLGEASALCGHYSENASNSSRNSSNRINLHENSTNEDITHHLNSIGMGLGGSSEPFPVTRNETCDTMVHSIPCTSSRDFSVHHPINFETSVNRPAQVSSSTCYHHSTSVQLHATPDISHISTSVPPILDSDLNISSLHVSPCTSNEACSTNHLCKIENKTRVQSSIKSSKLTEETGGISYQTNSHQSLHQAEALPMSTTMIREFQVTTTDAKSQITEFSSESKVHPESSTDACGQVIYNRHQTSSGSDYDTTLLPSTSKCINPPENHYGNSTASSSTGCGHCCSTCRVKVQVEVECVPTAQRSPNTNRRGIRTLSFPKRVRHKVKTPTKDLNGNHKKRKSPWSFRLNCRIRSNKSESEQEFPSLNVGCASCVCPKYHCSDNEPVYRSGDEASSPNNNSNIPIIDLPVYNCRPHPELLPVTGDDLDENARQERAREIEEGIDPPPGFIPINNQNALTLPFSYNSMLDLRMLFQNSLRLGLGSRPNGGVSYTGDPFISTCSPENSFSHIVHTQVDYIHCLVPDLLAITNCGFYWGKMDRHEAERLLENKNEGTFLLRDSAQEEYLFSVSFRRYDRSLHARIEQWNHKFGFDSHDPGVFASDTVCGLIEHYKDPSCCMFFEPLLTNPLARTFPFPLQHLSRATICSNTTYDGINKLDLPKSLKNYLKEYHYKQRLRVRYLDRD